LIGNLTRDPELRYTPQGSAVCTFGLATNRTWTSDTGERQEETVFHRIVAWSKLAEICSQLLGKGDQVFVEGRLVIRQWEGQDGVKRTTTEVVIGEMILLKSQKGRDERGLPEKADAVDQAEAAGEKAKKKAARPEEGKAGAGPGPGNGGGDEEVASDEIPF
jgi:single-strand DNA-binding protein